MPKTAKIAPNPLGQKLSPTVTAANHGISIDYLGRLRREGELMPGIHYMVLNPRAKCPTYRYFSGAIENYFANRDDPEAHLAWIEKQLNGRQRQ
jgi:hypothetical protein